MKSSRLSPKRLSGISYSEPDIEVPFLMNDHLLRALLRRMVRMVPRDIGLPDNDPMTIDELDKGNPIRDRLRRTVYQLEWASAPRQGLTSQHRIAGWKLLDDEFRRSVELRRPDFTQGNREDREQRAERERIVRASNWLEEHDLTVFPPGDNI